MSIYRAVAALISAMVSLIGGFSLLSKIALGLGMFILVRLVKAGPLGHLAAVMLLLLAFASVPFIALLPFVPVREAGLISLILGMASMVVLSFRIAD